MAIDWAVVCDFAYFDRAQQLCMMGVETAGPIRTLPTGIHRLAIAVHFHDRHPHDSADLALFVTGPDGDWRMADVAHDFCVESSGEYLLIRMPSVSLQAEGTYRFELACGTRQLVVCEVNVLANAPCRDR
jgi:uncharacterized protein DUF6941